MHLYKIFRMRFDKLNGKNILWIPGTDHSGIATQILVEKSILPATRHDLGREKFLDKIWEWKDKYQTNIYDQLKSLGITLNWDFDKFTMDDDIQAKVADAFCDLYDAGLIYRDKKIIHWDTMLSTAVSDLEVKYENVKGKLYHIKYHFVDRDGFIKIATTRPETMFGDQAIAVHSNDERYKDLIGAEVKIPLTGRKIPIIADDRCEIDVGTGAVKITPAHDFLDFEIGQDHKLTAINILNDKGMLCGDAVPQQYVGLSAVAVREKLIDDLQEDLDQIDNITHQVPMGDRSGTVLEPKLTAQWFVDTDDLAKKALEAIEEIDVYPSYFRNIYAHWMKNIHPWCISRQLWWGHRIPVWYCGDKIIVASDQEKAEEKAKSMGLDIADMKQDSDVLDTWFSSALWPFVTLETNNLSDKFYPNEFLVTGSDILFFWVARMVMFGCFFKKKIPFKAVYLHGLVQDDFGKKMSKSKNNVVDPMEIVNKEGIDVLRFALLYHSVPGKNIKFGAKNIEHSRHFCIKVWNLYNFIKNSQQSDKTYDSELNVNAIKHVWNRWIVSETEKNMLSIKNDIKVWDVHQSSQKIYKFVWNTVCSWYLEGAKSLLQSTEHKHETEMTFRFVMKKLMIALHPFIPGMTSYIYKDLFGENIFDANNVGISSNDQCSKVIFDVNDSQRIAFVQNTVEAVRFCKTIVDIENNTIACSGENYIDVYPIVEKIAKINLVDKDIEGITYPIEGGFIKFAVENLDREALIAKLTSLRDKIVADYDMLMKQKMNVKFMERAAEDAREKVLNRLDILEKEKEKFTQIIKMWHN